MNGESESKKTTDHEEIKKWIEERGGSPARVKGTENKGEGIGLLRINFPEGEEESLENVEWKDFFDTFEKKNLAFLFQDKTMTGEKSRFFKFVRRE